MALGEQAKQDMLGAEVAVPTPLGLLPGKVQDPMGRLGEPAEHLVPARTGTLIPSSPIRARLGHARSELSQQSASQPVEVDPERGNQRPSRAPVAPGQSD